MSNEKLPQFPHNSSMADATERAFNEAFCARTRALREGLGWTAADMAKALGIPSDRYRKYESRSPMPPYLIERFALITRVNIMYMLTGRRDASRPMALIENKEFSDDGT